MLQQRGLWNKAQYHAIEECTAWLEDSGSLVEDEVITHAWIIISINEMDVEQERVMVLTNKSLIRFKYNFNSSKIARNRHLQLSDIIGISIGPFANKPMHYGFSLTFASPENKTQNAHIYCPLDSSHDNAYRTMNAIADAVREFAPRLTVEEKTMTRTKTVRGAVLNKFKLGMFNGRSKSSSKGKDKDASSQHGGGSSSSSGLSSSSSSILPPLSSSAPSKDSISVSSISSQHGKSSIGTSSTSSNFSKSSEDLSRAGALLDPSAVNFATGDDDDFDTEDDDPNTSQFAQDDDDDDASDNEF